MPNSARRSGRIGLDDRSVHPVADVRGEVNDLIHEFEGDPGVELLNVVAAMLAQTHCTCAPVTGPSATVTALPTTGRTPSCEV